MDAFEDTNNILCSPTYFKIHWTVVINHYHFFERENGGKNQDIILIHSDSLTFQTRGIYVFNLHKMIKLVSALPKDNLKKYCWTVVITVLFIGKMIPTWEMICMVLQVMAVDGLNQSSIYSLKVDVHV